MPRDLKWKDGRDAIGPFSKCLNMVVREVKPKVYACSIVFRNKAIFTQTSRGTMRVARQTITRTRAYLGKCCARGMK